MGIILEALGKVRAFWGVGGQGVRVVLGVLGVIRGAIGFPFPLRAIGLFGEKLVGNGVSTSGNGIR
jgi:hypothetical protein